jgi:hypothetical protein
MTDMNIYIRLLLFLRPLIFWFTEIDLLRCRFLFELWTTNAGDDKLIELCEIWLLESNSSSSLLLKFTWFFNFPNIIEQ